jgi:hypothetical protein
MSPSRSPFAYFPNNYLHHEHRNPQKGQVWKENDNNPFESKYAKITRTQSGWVEFARIDVLPYFLYVIFPSLRFSLPIKSFTIFYTRVK